MNENVINLFVDATSFTRLRKAMLILAIRMLGNYYDAEDVVQDACVKLWQKREVYRNNLFQEALCAKVVRNLCIDRLRITQLNDSDEKALSSIACESIESEVECNDIKIQLNSILAALPQQHRKVFRMRAEGYTFEDISKATGIENGNVRCIISRIRKRVRLQMKTL